jgi:NADP-dependent aldehyde dehydrogenase
MAVAPVLLDGEWRASKHATTFAVENPATRSPIDETTFPVSSWDDCELAISAARTAAGMLRKCPGEQLAEFLERYAKLLEAAAAELVAAAHAETALAIRPRLSEVELPRTANQLRLAATAAREASWQEATIDTKLQIRSCRAAIGTVWVFGPNNFPFAFNGIAGGDFAAAIAVGNPVIAKANPGHPGTTRLLAELALAALRESGLPPATVQMLYHLEPADGLRAIADPRSAAIGFTGSRTAGLKLKAAADAAGKPIYLEMSSVNPVVILPGALVERMDAVVNDVAASALMGCGQFCTNPGLLLMLAGPDTETFARQIGERFRAAPSGVLLNRHVAASLAASVTALKAAGAEAIVGGEPAGPGYANTLLRASGQQFLKNAIALQTEAFGPVSLLVTANDPDELLAVLGRLEGNLTGTIYSDTRGADDPLYEPIAAALRPLVGRLLNDKMPTGVSVSSAMNHGGPFPATGHPGFTAVGIPASLRRFTTLECFDNVRSGRLPRVLQDANPLNAWRLVDGQWTKSPILG